MTGQALALQFIQKLDSRPVYSTKEAISITGSRDKAYRYLQTLKALGIAQYYTHKNHGYFTVNTTLASQPANIIEKILSSLHALKNARRFGRHYNNSDINFAMKSINHRLVTLDYAAWKLTKYQSTADYYVYVEDIEKTISYLKGNKFSEGRRGHVIILPMIGDFTNEIQRIYFDCLAHGGRSINDAIAIELLHPNRLDYKASFTVEMVEKVQDDLPNEK